MRTYGTKLISAAILALPMLAQPASAEDAQRRVSYSDLDLNTPRGAQIMLDRLEDAARWVCGGNPRFNPGYRTSPAAVVGQFEACYESALSTALGDLDAPEVTRAYAQAGAIDSTPGR